MPQGLLAQWQRGIALRGIVGVVLLMVPVVVAATIGFGGGVGLGLSSFVDGPRDSAEHTTTGSDSSEHRSASLDKLATTIPPVVAPREKKNSALGIPDRSNPAFPSGSSGPGAVASPPSAGASPESSGGASGSGDSAPQAQPGISAGNTTQSAEAPAAPPSTPVSGSGNPLADLLNGLLGGGASGP